MPVTSSIAETDVFTALRTFMLSIVDCEVIRLPANRAAMPKDFIGLTPLGSSPLETNSDTYNDISKTIKRATRVDVQVDCYGAMALDRANAITSLFRDDYGCQSLKASGFDMQPLYAEDAHQMPLVTGEDQYVERWTFELAIQVNYVFTVTQDSAVALVVGLKNVDRTFPP